MEDLLKVIYQKLYAVTTATYFYKAPAEAVFPYVVYKVPTSDDTDGCPNGSREDFILEVDIWDNIADTTRLESLTTSIDNALQRVHVNNANVAVSFYRINRLMIPDPDETINRRQLRYRLPTWIK